MLRFQKTDYVPVVVWGGSPFYADLAGYDVFQVYHDPNKLIEAQCYAFNMFPEIIFINGFRPDYGCTGVIASAFGAKLKWFRNDWPMISKFPIQNEQDIWNLEIPDYTQDGLFPWYLESLAMSVRYMPNFENVRPFLWSTGPAETACFLYGIDNFLLNLKINPKLTHHLLQKTTEIIIGWLEAQQRVIPDFYGLLITDVSTLKRKYLSSIAIQNQIIILNLLVK